MNIKRAILALGAFALSIGLFAIAPQEANAQTITCTITNTTGGPQPPSWPYSANVKGCTGTTKLGAVQTALGSVVGQYQRTVGGVVVGVGLQLKALTPTVFLFVEPAHYASFISGTNCPAIPGNVNAYTFLTPTCSITGNQPYTVVFETDGLYTNTYLANTVAHEMGHWLDEKVMGTVANPYSSSALFTHMLNKTGSIPGGIGDYPQFNALVSACAGYHVFNGIQDNHTPPHYICLNSTGTTLDPRYVGLTPNTAILNAAVPNFYSDPKELFAEIAAVLPGNIARNPRIDQHLARGQFACTQLLLRSEFFYGDPPGTGTSPYTGYPAGCPTN